MKKTSIFYGGGPVKDESDKKPGSAPLCGDPAGDLIVRMYAEASEEGIPKEMIDQRIKDGLHIANIVLSESDITVDGYKLEHLNPSVRAFYILVARHPEGIKRKVSPDPKKDKDSFDCYLGEYKEIFSKLLRTRKEKESKGISYDIDARFPHYRDAVNKAITAIEDAHKPLDLSSCKVPPTKCWKISANVVDLMAITVDPEL